jgi:hypothetical protein
MAKEQLDPSRADGDLSDREYDAIEQRVLNRVAPPHRATWKRAFAVVLPLVGVAAVAVVGFSLGPGASEFRAKGAVPPTAAAIEVSCGKKGELVCPRGSSLFFTVDSGVTSGYIGAYAQRIGGESASRIWYFPDAQGSGPRVEPGRGTVVLPEAIRIAGEHAPGRYVVTVWSSPVPISRRQLDGSVPGARASLTIEVPEEAK